MFEFSRRIFEKTRTKFNENPSLGDELLNEGGRVEIDMTKQVVAVGNFANAQNCLFSS
jgi:hypothetical protein